MAEFEKLIGLKKAYADIILNTAKEAVARVMASERRASRWKMELEESKEEALRMMVRLKHMMDSKIYEAEMLVSRQRNKIEELEAQLQEAEDIVKDLRDELSVVEDELSDVRRNESKQMSEHLARQVVTEEKKELAEGVSASVPSMLHLSIPQVGYVSSDMIDTIEGQIMRRGKYGNKGDYLEKSHADNLEAAPILVPTKETELDRNGSHQRIEEARSADSVDSFPGSIDVKKGDIALKASSEGKRMCKTPTPSAGLHILKRKSSFQLKGVQKNKKVLIRMTRRALSRRYKRAITPKSWKRHQSSVHRVKNSLETNSLVTLKACLTSVDTPSVALSSQTKLGLSVAAGSIQSTPENDKSSGDKVLNELENGSADSCITCVDVEIVHVPSSSNLEAPEELEKEVALQRKNDKSVKFTFQRKRKPDSAGCADQKDSLDKLMTATVPQATEIVSRSLWYNSNEDDTIKNFKRSLKRRNADTELEAISIIRPSEHRRQLAQVPRQIISTSEN